MQTGQGRRRVAAATLAVCALLAALTGCSLDTHVEVETPVQADEPFADATTQQL